MEIIIKSLIFLPLLAGIINGLFCKKLSNQAAQYISVIAMSVAAISAILVFINCGIQQQIIHIKIADWLHNNTVSLNWAIYVDQLTAIMFLLVTSVSWVVHVYSLGYMAEDKNLPKFLSYLSLFTFCMLMLVAADNFLQLFFGWEGVGVCSYLLIGYYYHKDSANKAAIKAFITNRVSDFAFVIGIVLIFIYANDLDFQPVFAVAENLSLTYIEFAGFEIAVLDVICLMLFIGCMGKSAQIGLHIWLPDAMEGPTPVSALIHAATMVTAGVFLIVRCSFLFEFSPNILSIIAVIGAITCLFASLIAVTQTDIKKIIAYSTCSQLGYMFFACGVSAYPAAMFHLVTHGFFKALLFLSAGSVIHATHQQDIFAMGQLRKKMPWTYLNFWLGSLAIMGIFPLAGFYSKDLILASAYMRETAIGNFAFGLGLIAASLTAIYSLKIIILVFHGNKSAQIDYDALHESPIIMNGPLIILLFGTVSAGLIGHYGLNIGDIHGYFTQNILNVQAPSAHHHPPLLIELLPMLAGIFGGLVALYLYRQHRRYDGNNPIYYLVQNKFFIDELYQKLLVNNTDSLARISNCIDKHIIDRFGPGGMASMTNNVSRVVSYFQTGYLHNYMLYLALAVIFGVTFFITKYLWVLEL